ncbi:MAG TPA: fasciclin domain-containing protein [Arachidicoccus sp.]|nr:fasciclin domain-containing protein [Arachidicoccus sp.]
MENTKRNGMRGGCQLMLLLSLLFTSFGCSKSSEGKYYDYQNANAEYDGNTIEFLQAQNGLYDSLLYVVGRVPNLKDSIANFNATFFAPTNQSFAIALQNLNELRAIQHRAPLNLTNIDAVELDTLLCRYVIPGAYISDSLSVFTDGISVPSLRYHYNMTLRYNRQDAQGYQNGGPQEIIFSDPKNSIFERYWVSTYTTSVNIHTKNGIVHLLSGGHEFGFGEFMRRMNK